MRLDEAQKILEAEIVVDANLQSIEVEMGCGADLMSDVLSFAKKDALLLTGLTNPQVVRTCEMTEVAAICFVRGKKPMAQTILLARKHGLPLLATHMPMFESCGRLYAHGLKGCSEVNDQAHMR